VKPGARFAASLAASLVLHLWLVWQWFPRWTGDGVVEPLPIEARLEGPAAQPPKVAQQAPAVPPRRRAAPAAAVPEPSAATAPAPPQAAEPDATPAAVEPAATGESPAPLLPGAAAPAPPDSAASPAAAPAIRLNPLPRRVELAYRVRYGPATGSQVLVWVREGDTYTVTSVVAPTGLTSLFYSARFSQTSRGRFTDRGLVPEQFWEQRGDKRSQARFDQEHATLVVESSKGVRTLPLPPGAQDSLSLFFQLALVAPDFPAETGAVFSGKSLNSYRYRVVGEEPLETRLGTLRTLHVERVVEGRQARFEVWLAIERFYLPVRVLRVEDSGVEAELNVERLERSD
jgi:hypothetical protein